MGKKQGAVLGLPDDRRRFAPDVVVQTDVGEAPPFAVLEFKSTNTGYHGS
jgi:hypothetical protein